MLKGHFSEESWPRKLLSVLPCGAAEVIARLSVEDSDVYAKVKSCLLKRYRLSAEVFSQKFGSATKMSDTSYAEFACEHWSYLIQWLKCAESYDDRTKMVLEQLYWALPDSQRTWIQKKTGVDSVHKAADLADV